MKLLLTGGSGFVARSLARHFSALGHTVTAMDKNTLNIGDERAVRLAIAQHAPDVILNAAGDKNLQRCEDDSQRAMRINAYAPAMLARVCGDMGAKFVHIGSDHAFATPLTAYGESKRVGQEMVMAANPDALVAVSGHIYDVDCPWLVWLDGELRAGRTVEAWGDISNWPTYAGNLAAMIADMLRRGWKGIYTCVGSDYVDRFELFTTYAKCAGLNRNLITVYPSPCPSLLHPRRMDMPAASSCVEPMGIREGFTKMLLRTKEKGVAA